MAKKRTGKASRKAARRTGGTRTSKKAKAARKPAKRSGARAAARGPVPVKTGGGAAPAQIGRAVVEGFNGGRPDHELWDRWWSPKATSVEGGTTAMAWNGRKAMDDKAAWWTANFKVHGASAEGPYLGATGFSVKYKIDAEEKATGKREVMEEVGVYTVQNGKIVREEFYAGTRAPVSSGATRREEAADAMAV